MKLNRFVALATIALLVVGAIGAIAARTFAQSSATPTAQDCAQDQADDALKAQNAGPDTDTLEVQCGDQNEAGDGAEANDADDAAPSGTPAISADAAQKTAEAYLNAGTASEVELENENGQLVYSVEIGGTDVNVDAMSGAVLGTAGD